jgi:hypothetical protein
VDAISSKEPDNSADKPAVPPGLWGSILTTTPIVLTILATLFAGLSSSEMTQSMYYRSLAAQHQSKAGDQWGFFQAKRLRGTNLEMTNQLLQSLVHSDDFDPAQVDATCAEMLRLLENSTDTRAQEAATKIQTIRGKLAALLAEDTTRSSFPYLTGEGVPKVETRTLDNQGAREAIAAVTEAIHQRKTEAETASLVAPLNPSDIEAATRLAEEDADRFDKACDPVNKTLGKLRTLFGELAAAIKPLRSTPALSRVVELADQLNNSFNTAALDFGARRYRREADLNLRAAEMYEVRVRRSSVASDRHRERSKHFFYCMLLAQGGVTIASLALARTQRNLLWLVAAVAGVVALGFSMYVYLLF